MSKNPIVTIEMENGKQIKIELMPEVAMNTVNNFVSLVKAGFYNGLISPFRKPLPYTKQLNIEISMPSGIFFCQLFA